MKSQLLISTIWILASLLASPHQVSAQEIMKHARVVELEDSLKDSASEYVKARFPSEPFMVTVRVDPLRRELPAKFERSESDLPFYSDDTGEEIRDEWDNPQIPLNALLNRVKRIRVTIAIPSSLNEADVNEVKEGIYSILHLTPARDEIEISRRNWQSDKIPWLAIYIAGALVLTLLLGLLGINRSSANRIARALTDLKQGISSSQSSAGTHSATPLETPLAGKESGKGQELKFNDPIKMKELASRHIEFLISSPAFPNHLDVFALDGLGKLHPEKLGAILAEFPAEMQRKIFAHSSDFHWIEAMNEPGFLDFECLEVYQSLIQNPRSELEMERSRTILAVWRLGDLRTQFLKGLEKSEAFSLLTCMPKAVAVSEARRAFPGSWAAVLDPQYTPATLSPQRLAEIKDQATRILPLHDMALVRRYRDEKELLDYLKTSDPVEERDIYGAAPVTSLIHKLRPPFFTLFDQEPETLAWIVPVLSLDQWALALFNVAKHDRIKIDAHLSDKQKFMLIEKFKKFDSAPPAKDTVGSAREHIGQIVQKWLKDKVTADQVNAQSQTMEEDAPAA